MLVGTPFPVNLSVFVALGPALWIRRVLVRSQEGQLECLAFHAALAMDVRHQCSRALVMSARHS